MEGSSTKFQHITKTLSLFKKTYLNHQIPPSLSQRAHQQGGFLPRKKQNAWNHWLEIYNIIQSETRVITTQSCPTWHNHQDIYQLCTLTNVTTLPTLIDKSTSQKWIEELAIIGRTVEKHLQTNKT